MIEIIYKIYKNEYIFILTKKATNKFLLDCLFLYPKQSKIVLKIRSPPVLLLNFKLKVYLRIGDRLMNKKYYIAINGEKFEVSKEVYNTYYRSREKERYFMYTKKKGKIIIEDEDIIFKDSVEISLEKLEELGLEIQDDFNLEEKILLDIDIEILKEALSKLSNNEYRIILEIFYNCKSEREVAKELNCCNVVLHNKKKKILYKLKDYLKNNKFI